MRVDERRRSSLGARSMKMLRRYERPADDGERDERRQH
jgi:hypothetical protein